ncbi:hypothetical protein DFH09DRAFT_1141263 [Mycena vulgaris]|nr:hypothetical protein DFH09DRAFT_1141263 [Mycena vulgaris]
MPSPPPSPYEDTPDIPIHTVYARSTTPTPRDFSALRSEAAHLWRTIRRRNHRLLPQRRPFPCSLPKRVPQLPPPPTPSAPLHLLRHSEPFEHPLPVLALPRATPLPDDPPNLFHLKRDPPYRALPADPVYGTAQSALAAACAKQFPWIYLARARIADIAWPPDDERENYLVHLPCDQLIFLATMTEMMDLEPDLAIFFQERNRRFCERVGRPL